MQPTLRPEELDAIADRLGLTFSSADRTATDMTGRQPVHVVYGGAHLFATDTAEKLGRLAIRALREHCPDPHSLQSIFGIADHICSDVYSRIASKLEREAVEDLRIDFEDGYGYRLDAEEDGHAAAAAAAVADGMAEGLLPPFIGIRIKALSREGYARAIRTLDIFLSSLVKATDGRLPRNFVVTLPKIVSSEQVGILVSVFCELEGRLGLPPGVLKMELMIETPQSLFTPGGEFAIPKLLDAADGRCIAAHFGAYDYTASLGITSEYQDMLSKSCDFARSVMQVSMAGTGVRLSDGATNIMPVPRHRGEYLSPKQVTENRNTIHRAWKLHYDHCRHSLANGFYQGWDLHPAQIVSRYAAVYSFFLEGLDAAGERLRNFIEKAAKATLVGDVFDDAATGQGLLNYFVRAVNCGAITKEEAALQSGLTSGELLSGSFKFILDERHSK